MHPSNFTEHLQKILEVGESVLDIQSYERMASTSREPNSINGSEQNDDIQQSSKGDIEKLASKDDYWRLYEMIQKQNWAGVEMYVRNHHDALTDMIDNEETLIDLIIRFGDYKATWLIDKLVKLKDSRLPEARQKFEAGTTTLKFCAASGNLRAIKVLVSRNNADLLNNEDEDGLLPVHYAALNGQKETFQYLLENTGVDIYSGIYGAQLLVQLIDANLYDIALDLLNRHPAIGRDDIQHRAQILGLIAEKPLAFESGRRLGRWKSLIYHCIPVKIVSSVQTNDNQYAEGDIKTPTVSSSGSVEQFTFLPGVILRNALKYVIVPSIKDMYEQKRRHKQAVEIVRILCDGVIWTNPLTRKLLTKAFFKAARLGISEFVSEYIKAYKGSAYWKNQEGHTIFHVAVLHRRVNIFNLIYSLNFKFNWLGVPDESGNNILHLAGKFVPSSEEAGAALQMQRELQWFKAVEELVHPSYREVENNENQTPREVFTKEHSDLVKKGEKWMKGTASSCSVVAALIITVVFGAGFNVPGGIDLVGKPKLLSKQAFIIFAISDGLALFSSIYSVINFLGILTSRYSEDDFLVSAPEKLIDGLLSLLFSIATMMVAFGAAIYLNLYRRWKLVFIPIGIIGCLPVIWFAWLKLPLFLDMCFSTYVPGFFTAQDLTSVNPKTQDSTPVNPKISIPENPQEASTSGYNPQDVHVEHQEEASNSLLSSVIDPMRGKNDPSIFTEFNLWYNGKLQLALPTCLDRDFYAHILGHGVVDRWLSDSPIDKYLVLIADQQKKYPGLFGQRRTPINAYFFDFFYNKWKILTSEERADLSKVEFVDNLINPYFHTHFRDFDYILAPVNIPSHWFTAEIKILERKIVCYDSSINAYSDYKWNEEVEGFVKLFPWWLVSVGFYDHRPEQQSDASPWSITRSAVGVPQQKPESGDCGVFTVIYILYRMLDISPTFDANCVEFFRRKMALDLFYNYIV